MSGRISAEALALIDQAITRQTPESVDKLVRFVGALELDNDFVRQKARRHLQALENGADEVGNGPDAARARLRAALHPRP